MDFVQIFQALLALIFVLGLMFLTLWLIKLCQQKGLTFCLSHCTKRQNRIKILEQHRIDIKNSVVLVQCDNDEFLLLCIENKSLILRQTKL